MSGRHVVLHAVALTACLFGLLVWGYVIIVQVTHPDWMATPLSHLPVFPFNWRLDEVGLTSFAIAAIGFFVWQIERNLN